MSGGSLVIIILCSIYAGVLFASPIKREIGTENLCHWVNEEECDEIATQLLKNSSCGWNRIKVNRSSADELCSDAVTVVKMIREIIEELMKNRNLMSDDGQNVCNYETSTVAYFLKENEQCWSAENASQTIVHAYVYLTRIVLKHLSVANPIEQVKRYEVLLAKLDELRCSFWCFGHNTYEFESEAREDVLVELRNLDPLPSPDVNDTQVRFHECRVLTKLDAKVEEIKRHWEKNVEKC